MEQLLHLDEALFVNCGHTVNIQPISNDELECGFWVSVQMVAPGWEANCPGELVCGSGVDLPMSVKRQLTMRMATKQAMVVFQSPPVAAALPTRTL